MITKLRNHLKSRIEGTAAIEFAYIAPLLLLMLLGTIEVARAVGMDRRFGLVTAMISDLVSREKSLGTSAGTTQATLQGMMTSATTVMSPYPTTGLTFKIRSIMALKADTTQGTVKWSYDCTPTSCSTSADKAACASYALPAGIVTMGSSVVVVESSVSYSPIFLNWTGNTMHAGNWSDKSTHSPRQSCVDDGSGCSAPAACPNG
jgi:Flp pilus assembly protein TadG